MISAQTSIIPEFIEKIDMMGVAEDFRITKDEIINLTTGSSIIFKGIRTSSGNQTAALKSLNGVTTFVLDEAEELVDELRRLLTGVELESFSDYPDAVKNNAKRGRELNEKQGNKCATETGKQRSADLAAGRPVTVDTIKRMYSYLSRAEEYYDEGNTEACGTISYLLWGGKAAKRWAESKLKELDLIDLKAPCQDGYEMIGMKEKDGRLVPNCVPIK
jgi:hypothetical protein